MTTLDRKPEWSIVIHWTAGHVNDWKGALPFYHFVFDNNGVMHTGYCDPEDNINCYDGKYAAHLARANTKSIGLAVTGAHKNFKHGEYKRVSLESLCYQAAKLSIKYSIPIERNYIFTHHEFGLRHPNTANRGKIDINNIPYKPELKPSDVGDYIRNKILWYQGKILEVQSFKPVNNPDTEARVQAGERFSKAFDALLAGRKIRLLNDSKIYDLDNFLNGKCTFTHEQLISKQWGIL